MVVGDFAQGTQVAVIGAAVIIPYLTQKLLMGNHPGFVLKEVN